MGFERWKHRRVDGIATRRDRRARCGRGTPAGCHGHATMLDVPDRLSPLDVSFLYFEEPTTPMHVGGVAVFQEPAGGFDHDRLVELISQRIAFVPRYRQRLADSVATALDLGGGIVNVHVQSDDGEEERLFSRDLACVHCRADAQRTCDPSELCPADALRLDRLQLEDDAPGALRRPERQRHLATVGVQVQRDHADGMSRSNRADSI